MADKTHWKKIVSDPNYLGEADFQTGEEKILTIKGVNQAETIMTAEGRSQKAVLHFMESVKPMILNVTNSKAIQKAVGSPYFEDWPGNVIQLYIDPHVKAFGEVVAAVRVRPRKPVVKQATKCADCGGDIVAAAGKGADYIEAGTKKTYGVPLCWNCAGKRMKAKQEGAEQNGSAEADG